MATRHDAEPAAAAPLRDLYPQEHRGGAGAGVQLARRAARGLRGLHPEPEARGLDLPAPRLRRRRLLRRLDGPPRPAPAAGRRGGRRHRCRGRLQGRPADPGAGRLRPHRRGAAARAGLPERRSPVQPVRSGGSAQAHRPHLGVGGPARRTGVGRRPGGAPAADCPGRALPVRAARDGELRAAEGGAGRGGRRPCPLRLPAVPGGRAAAAAATRTGTAHRAPGCGRAGAEAGPAAPAEADRGATCVPPTISIPTRG